jgi:predicted double-glycine peptidase
MNPWFETLLVVVLSALGAMAGGWLSRRPAPWWIAGYVGPMIVVLAFMVAARFPRLAFHSAFSWVVMGRQRYLVGAVAIPMLLMTVLPKLPRPRDRSAVVVMMICGLLAFSVWPCLSAALSNRELLALRTRIDADGVCRQNTDYTCGPAAAVTALRRLGIRAGEGELAQLAFTSPAAGTPPDMLADVLREKFSGVGLKVDLRPFKDLDELAAAGLTMVVVKFGLLTDHWVVVLKVSDEDVLVADPDVGLVRESREKFASTWRGYGITLSRENK